MPVLRRDRAHAIRDRLTLTFTESKPPIDYPMLAFLGPTEVMFLSVLVVPMVLGGFAFWVWMLVDCVRNPRLTDTERIIWAIVICFAHFVGALIYFFAGRRPVRQPASSAIR